MPSKKSKKKEEKKKTKKSSEKEQVKFLKILIEEMAGEGAEEIADILYGKKDVNEFLIAKKMKMTINQVRNILYKLSAEGLVSFIRKKDKRKGWYIYFWTLNTEKCLVKLEQTLINKIRNLNSRLKNRETKRFYQCKSCNIEVGEEKALEHGFICSECAEVYELVNNKSAIRDIKIKTGRKKRELRTIQEELKQIREKKIKKKQRAEKREMKKKKAKRKKHVKKKAKKKLKKPKTKKKPMKKKKSKSKKKSKKKK
jgi:transcription factor E